MPLAGEEELAKLASSPGQVEGSGNQVGGPSPGWMQAAGCQQCGWAPFLLLVGALRAASHPHVPLLIPPCSNNPDFASSRLHEKTRLGKYSKYPCLSFSGKQTRSQRCLSVSRPAAWENSWGAQWETPLAPAEIMLSTALNLHVPLENCKRVASRRQGRSLNLHS